VGRGSPLHRCACVVAGFFLHYLFGELLLLLVTWVEVAVPSVNVSKLGGEKGGKISTS
jgi:hypothetical protein